jgi:hypothetical protein
MGRRDKAVEIRPGVYGYKLKQCESEVNWEDDCPLYPGRCCVQCPRQSRCRLPGRCTPNNGECFDMVKEELNISERKEKEM